VRHASEARSPTIIRTRDIGQHLDRAVLRRNVRVSLRRHRSPGVRTRAVTIALPISSPATVLYSVQPDRFLHDRCVAAALKGPAAARRISSNLGKNRVTPKNTASERHIGLDQVDRQVR
jgi:hypothetical protein